MPLDLPLDRGRGKSAPLYRQIAEGIAAAITAGRLSPGTRLPTVRELALRLRVTPMTVQSAYAQLQRRHLANAVVGRGTFVGTGGDAASGSVPGGSRASDPVHARAPRSEVAGILSLAQATVAAELQPAAAFMAGLRSLTERTRGLREYQIPQGAAVLRREVARRLGARGISASADALVLTQGVTEALDLLIEVLCRPGDSVLVESPSYVGLLDLLRHHHVDAIALEGDAEGVGLELMQRALRRHRPRFLYTVPTHRNPTGTSMSLQRRRDLLRVAERYDLLVIEDDVQRDLALATTPPPALAALAPPERVIYLDGYSKSVMPGLRIGYLHPPRSLFSRLSQAHRVRTLCGPSLLQAALAGFLRRGELEAHLGVLLPILTRRRQALLGALAATMPDGVTWTEPEGGCCLWLSLPSAQIAAAAQPAALAAGVAVAPGDRFLPRPDGRGHLRLSFGSIDEGDIPRAVGRLAQVLGARLRSRAPVPTAAEVALV